MEAAARVLFAVMAVSKEVGRRDAGEPPDSRFDSIIDSLLDFADEFEASEETADA